MIEDEVEMQEWIEWRNQRYEIAWDRIHHENEEVLCPNCNIPLETDACSCLDPAIPCTPDHPGLACSNGAISCSECDWPEV